MRGTWVYNPAHVHRKRIPDEVRETLQERLERHAERHWKKHCRQVTLRFHGPYAYVGAIPTKQELPPWLTKQQRRLAETTPRPLCRLGYRGRPDEWVFSYYRASRDGYETSLLPSSSYAGTPEECFDCAADVHLRY